MKHYVVIGSGAREISAVEAIFRSALFRSMEEAVIDVLPGGGGFAWLALQGLPVKNHSNFKATDIAGIVNFCIANTAEFVFVGPEAPLDDGLVDRLEDAGICVFGPRKSAAIEGSKSRQKKLMKRAGNIPTADYQEFTDYDLAVAYVMQHPRGYIKADGLAGGKGAERYDSADAGIAILRRFMIDGCYGDAGRKVLIEELLEGGNEKEVSLMILCDGTGHYEVLVVTQDHKPVGVGNTGKNTGGMGAWGPVLWVERFLQEIKDRFIGPMLEAIALDGVPFKGCLYLGLMITPDGPKVVEWNNRFGDPEGPVVLDLLSEDVDVLALFIACAKGKLAEFGPIPRKSGFTVCVALCAEGYPDEVTKGDEIFGIEEAEQVKGIKVILSGTTLRDGRPFTNSGRAVYVISHSDESLGVAIAKANVAAKTIKFRGKHFRDDIGLPGMKALEAEGAAV